MERSAALLLEDALEALEQSHGLGATEGRWEVTLLVDDGRVRRVRLEPAAASVAVTLGRRELDEHRDGA